MSDDLVVDHSVSGEVSDAIDQSLAAQFEAILANVTEGPWDTGVYMHGNCQVNSDADYYGKDGQYGSWQGRKLQVGQCTECGRGEIVAKMPCCIESCANQHHVHREIDPADTSIYVYGTETMVVDGSDSEYTTKNINRGDADFMAWCRNHSAEILAALREAR